VDPVAAFNSLPAERLRAGLHACCASAAWVAAVEGGRPYPSRDAVLAAGDAAARSLSWSDVLDGLAAHPRIGDRPAGASAEAEASRREQAAAAGSADEETAAALVVANREYETRFGHVFLIFANGRTSAEILAAARERLGNDEAAERVIVADELRQIARLRLERMLDALG
jgi:2-oxo-4-hydroxy-4-carboxy-5-ureidoimidazoline decarboxylase